MRRAPQDDPVRRAILGLALLATIGVLLVWAKLIVVALLVGIGLGTILAPWLGWLQQRLHVPRGIAGALVAVIGLSLLAALGLAFANMVDAQAGALAERAPALIQQLQERATRLLSRYPWLARNAGSLDLAGGASGIGAALFKGAWSGVGVLSALVFALMIGLYVAVDARRYREALVRALPAPRRVPAARFLGKAAHTVRNWFHAQLLDMVIMSVLTSLGLWAVGADYWLLLGVLTGLLGIIPYVGILIVIAFATLLTLAADPSRLPWVLGVFVVTQQLEGNVILPLVMRGRANLPAVPLLVFMLLLGTWAGLLGVLIAPPLFAVLRLAYCEFYLPGMDAARKRDPARAGTAIAAARVPHSSKEPAP